MSAGTPVICCMDINPACTDIYNQCANLISNIGNITFTNYTYQYYRVYNVPNQVIGPDMTYVESGSVAFPNQFEQAISQYNQFPALLFANVTYITCVPDGCDDGYSNNITYGNFSTISSSCVCSTSKMFSFNYVGRNEVILHLADPIPGNGSYAIAEVNALPNAKYGLSVANDMGEWFNELTDDYGDVDSNVMRRRADGGMQPDTPNPTCTVSYIIDYPKTNNLTLFYRNPPPYIWVVTLRDGNYYNLIECTGFICSYSLPVDLFYTQGYLYIDVQDPPNICASFVIYIPGENRCAPQPCVLTCLPTAIKYYNCQPSEIKLQLWLMLVALIVVVVYFWWVWVLLAYHTVKIVVKLPGGAYIVVKAVVCSRALSWLGSKIMSGTYLAVSGIGLVDAKNAIFGEAGKLKEVDMEKLRPESVTYEQVRMGGGGRLGHTTSILLVCLIGLVCADDLSWDQLSEATVPPFAQCSFTNVATGSFTSCTTKNNAETNAPYQQCQSVFSIELSALGLGKTGCVDIMKDGVFTGKMYVQYETMIATATLTSEYYTSDWTFDFDGEHYCSNTRGCNSQPCSDYNTGKVPPSYSPGSDKGGPWIISKPEILGFKGVQACIIRKPNPASGLKLAECWPSSGVCMVGFASVQPIGKVFQVFSINGIQYTPVINVFYVDAAFGAAFSETLIVNAGVAQSSNGYTLVLNGNFMNPSDTLFGNNYAILDIDANAMYLGPAAPFGTPQQGIVGDIQFFSPELPGNGNLNYNFASGMVTITGSTALKAGYAVRRGMETFSTATYSLPKTFNNNVWAFDGTQIVANLSSAGAASFTITTVGDGVTVSVYSPQVCPDINVINATGCYNCLEGSVLNVQLATRCDSGWVTVRTDDKYVTLATTSIFLAAGEDITWLIPFLTNKAENSFTVTICDETAANCDHDLVNFIAFEYTRNDTDFNQGNYTETYVSLGAVGLHPKGALDFFNSWVKAPWYNFFNGLADGLEIFIFFLELLLFCVIGYYLVVGFKKLNKTSQMDKMKKEMSEYYDGMKKYMMMSKSKVV